MSKTCNKVKLSPQQELAKWTIENNKFTIIHAERQQGLSTCLLHTAFEACEKNKGYSVMFLVDSWVALLNISHFVYNYFGESDSISEMSIEKIRFKNGSRLYFAYRPIPGFTSNLIIFDNFQFSTEDLYATIPTLSITRGSFVIGHTSNNINLPSYFLNLLGTECLKDHKKVSWRGFCRPTN